MKLRTPFTVFTNPLRDLDYIHDFSYQLPQENNNLFWEKECNLHPAKSTCKLYEVQTESFVVIQGICIQKLSMFILGKHLELMHLLIMQEKEKILLLLIYWRQQQGLVSLQ